jgi:phospholipase/carboxylesterase/glyoxalase family protein
MMIVDNGSDHVNDQDLGFIHQYVAGRTNGTGPTLLLLHGTGGDETSLIGLGELLAPGYALLSPRGKVLENGMPRFFRRISEGLFDVEDLRFRTRELAGFVRDAPSSYGIDTNTLIAVGYSNGANIAASLLLLEPGLLHAAVLFRAMVPFEPERLPDLSGTSVYLGSGRSEPLVPPDNAARLAEILRGTGADVELRWMNGGHGLSADDVSEAGAWISRIVQRWTYNAPGNE